MGSYPSFLASGEDLPQSSTRGLVEPIPRRLLGEIDRRPSLGNTHDDLPSGVKIVDDGHRIFPEILPEGAVEPTEDGVNPLELALAQAQDCLTSELLVGELFARLRLTAVAHCSVLSFWLLYFVRQL